MNHTKGKWIVKHKKSGNSPWVEEERTGQLICDFVYSANDNTIDKANAEFIAAAPRMYEALDKIQERLSFLDKGVNSAGDKQISDAYTVAADLLQEINGELETEG